MILLKINQEDSFLSLRFWCSPRVEIFVEMFSRNFFFPQCNFIYNSNTNTTYNTDMTLTFTLTIYLLITLLILTLLIHALLYNTILKRKT